MLKNTVEKIFTKNNLKKAGAGVMLCAIAMGGFSFYHHQAKAADRERLIEAESTMITAQAAQQNIKLIDESQLKSIVAQNIGIDEGSISNFKSELFDLNNRPQMHDKHGNNGHDGWKHDNDNRQHNGGRHDKNRQDCPAAPGLGNPNCPYNNQQAPSDNMTPPQAPPNNNMTPPQPPTDNMAQPQTPEGMDKANMPQPPAMPAPNGLMPMYKVICSANDVNYIVCVDAQNGNVINTRILP